MRAFCSTILLAALLGATPTIAKRQPDGDPPPSIKSLLACRLLTDAAARLSCFDGESGKVETSLATRDLVVIDKERARVAGRSMFGFSIPNFGGLFGSGGEIKSIDGLITSIGRNIDGGWLIKLDDGSVWSQSDDSSLGLPPRVRDKVTIRRGALGSFVMSIGGQPGFKTRRVG